MVDKGALVPPERLLVQVGADPGGDGRQAAAAELLPEGSLDYAALNIPEDLFATKQFAEDLGDYESVYQEIWSEFKLS